MDANLRISNCGWAFRCPLRWDSLTPTANSTVRHCSKCEQLVFLCETEVALKFHAGRRHCVALPPVDEAKEWVLMGRYVLPPYSGPTLSLVLEPTTSLNQRQLQFLKRSFDRSEPEPQLRSELCNGQAHLLDQALPPDRAKKLSQRLKQYAIAHRLLVNPD